MVDKNNPIPPELEKQIQDYGNFLFNPGQTWNSNNLEKEVFKYLDKYGHGQYGDSGTLTDKLSSRFAQIWAVYYRLGRFLEADKFWDLPLNLYTKWGKTNNKIVARGTPYYFRGMSAVAYGNIDRGFLFLHQAVEDDFNEGFRPYKKGKGNHSPAWLFVTFDYSDPRQAGGPLLKRRADWLNKKISEYQNSGRGALSLESLSVVLSLKSFGEKVLDEKQLVETTFSFTYNIFRIENLLSYLQEYRTGRFASQLSLDILFSLCRIGEVWLTKKQGKDKGLLACQLDIFFKNCHANTRVDDISKFKSLCNDDFEECVKRILNNKQVLSPKNIEPWESDLILIYVLRNEASHAPTSSPVISERFNELVERVFFGLFKIVEALY